MTTTVKQRTTLPVNQGKRLEINVNGKTYQRIPVKTHFVKVGEDYFSLLEKYVMPVYQEGDILVSSEKVLALCQGDVILINELKITPLARLLSKFATKNPAGPAMDNVYKMQAAIKMAGPLRIICAAMLGALGKLVGKKGLFYDIAGNGVRNIDGFCMVAFDYYRDKGVLAPSRPAEVCERINNNLGINCAIVDANDLEIEVLGKNVDMPLTDDLIKNIIQDNPAGQGSELTPFILIRNTLL